MWAEPGSPEAEMLDQTAFTQPALFTFEYALAALWRSWGVEPELVAGHSIGELVAACVAGVFSLEDAVRLVAARGRLMQALPAGGAMVSIAAPEAEVVAAVASHAASVSIAAVNGPEQVVIAGTAEPVQAIAAAFSARGVRTKSLRVSHAFHSPLMQPMLEAFGRVAESITYHPPSLPLISNLSGKLVTNEVSAPGYWVRHVREAVRFADGVRALAEAGAGTLVEVGPKATLLGLVPACLPGAEPALVASLRAGRDEAASVLEALGGIWAAGGAVTWTSIFSATGRRVSLPTYPWQRQRYWAEVNARRRRSTGAEKPIADWFYRVDWPRLPALPADPIKRSRGAGWCWPTEAGSARRSRRRSRHVGFRAPCSMRRPTLPLVAERWPSAAEARTSFRECSTCGGSTPAPAPGLGHEVGEATREPHAGARARSCAGRDAALASALDRDPRGVRNGWRVRGRALPGRALGLGRVAALEHPANWGGLVDLDLQHEPDRGRGLAAELLAPEREDQLALRKGRRYAARLTAAPPEGGCRHLALSAEGSYLVTGELAGSVCTWRGGWLSGARGTWCLTSSGGLPDQAAWSGEQSPDVRARIAAVEALEALGAQVTVAPVDVTDSEGMAALVAAAEPPLRGVVHAAGVGEVRPPRRDRRSPAGFAALRLKVVRGWMLHRYRGQPLDLFVLFSSVSGGVGRPRQGRHAAASAFLDGLAHQRSMQGLPALSIGWGPWAEGDLRRGELSARQETSACCPCPRRPPSRPGAPGRYRRGAAMVARMDWARLARYAARGRRGLLDGAGGGDERRVPTRRGGSPELAGPVRREARKVLRGLVRATVAEVLGFANAGALDAGRGFTEQGLDSLMAVQIRNRLQSELGVSLSSTMAFDHPTVERVAASC